MRSVKKYVVVGAVMAVFLLLATGFSGSVYARVPSNVVEQAKSPAISEKPKILKNTKREKIVTFKVKDLRIILHYKLLGSRRYTVWITTISSNGKRYTASYTIDQKAHTAYVNGKPVKIFRTYELTAGKLVRDIHHKWWDNIYCVYGRPQIKYMHPARDFYDIGTWENEVLSGKNLYHMQIGTDDIGWISELPGALVGAAIGSLVGALLAKHPIAAAIGAVIGAFVGFLTGNIIKKEICDETGAGWIWINKKDVRELATAASIPFPIPVHIDYFKMGMLGPYKGWVVA